MTVSVIGGTPRMVDPDRHPLDAPSAALLLATAQGLVRFDAAGQIEPGLAMRWDVSDDGLFYTFRLDERLGVDAGQAARRLRATVAAGSRNPFVPILGAIREVVAVTPEIVEIRLSSPRPNLLDLLAQPEMTIAVGARGGGPFDAAARPDGALRLTRRPDPDADSGDDSPPDGAALILRGERAAVAVARFAPGRSAAVMGGTFADVAVARAAGGVARDLRFDPAPGLFGLAFEHGDGPLGVLAFRNALSAAIDRDRLVAAFGAPGWGGQAGLVAAGSDDVAASAAPGWSALSADARRAAAGGVVAAWRQGHGGAPIRLRIALPAGPGGRLLFTRLLIDWRAIGVEAEAVATDAPAELRLIDQVAPSSSGSWALRRFTCDRSAVCDAGADAALVAARQAPTLPERNRALAAAEARLSAVTPFIPLASPLRWSLVAPGVAGWRDNVRAVHPLAHLRDR